MKHIAHEAEQPGCQAFSKPKSDQIPKKGNEYHGEKKTCTGF
jgi:hypothetical protein